jgi:hypothetical protein
MPAEGGKEEMITTAMTIIAPAHHHPPHPTVPPPLPGRLKGHVYSTAKIGGIGFPGAQHFTLNDLLLSFLIFYKVEATV